MLRFYTVACLFHFGQYVQSEISCHLNRYLSYVPLLQLRIAAACFDIVLIVDKETVAPKYNLI